MLRNILNGLAQLLSRTTIEQTTFLFALCTSLAAQVLAFRSHAGRATSWFVPLVFDILTQSRFCRLSALCAALGSVQTTSTATVTWMPTKSCTCC